MGTDKPLGQRLKDLLNSKQAQERLKEASGGAASRGAACRHMEAAPHVDTPTLRTVRVIIHTATKNRLTSRVAVAVVFCASPSSSSTAMQTELPQCKPAALSRILYVITVARKDDAAPAKKHTPVGSVAVAARQVRSPLGQPR